MDDINKKYRQLNKSTDVYLYSRAVTTSISVPTENDYIKGYVNRYFVRKANDLSSPILEVSAIQFSELSANPLYTIASLRWRITGPKESVYDSKTGRLIDMGVRESNRKSLELASNNIPNLSLHFPNLTQFWKNI